MKRKKMLVEMIISILLCLFLISDIQSAIVISPEPKDSPFPKATQGQSIEDNSKCATMMILGGLTENQKILSLGVQSQLTAVSLRPTDPGGDPIEGKQHLLPQLYNTTNFVLHWTNGSDDGGNSTDATSLEYVESFAGIFEHVYDFEVNTLGFHAPPNDTFAPNYPYNNRNPDWRYDIFIYRIPYYGYAVPEQWPNSSSYSYIGVRNNYTGFGHAPSPLEAMQVTAAHEFFHAIQFYYDCTEEIWWMETTATYMEDEVYPDVNDNYRYLPSWFLLCDWCGLEYTNGWHEYGNFIFAKRISEDFGNATIREIWEEMISTNGLMAIENVLFSKNSTLVDEFSKFITANFFLEDFYEDGFEYRDYLKTTPNANGILVNGTWVEYEYDASIAPNPFEVTDPTFQLDKWATDYITLKLDPAKQKYRISFDGLNLTATYLVKLVTKKGGNFSETMFTLDAQKGTLDLSYDNFDNVTLIIANVGNAYAKRPSWKVTIEVISPFYDVAITDVESSTYLAFTEQNITIAVTVKNNGNTRDESFDVWTWWGDFLIATEPVTSLAPGNEAILTIDWTIPSGLNGSEKIWANATIVQDETNIENNRFEDGMLTITIGIHDLTVRNGTPSKTITGQGQNLNINVTVANQGNYTETFSLTTYANTTVIQTKTVTLESNVSAIIVFGWNTTGFAIGNYTISAYAEPVPGETNVDDNLYTDGIIQIVPPVHDIAITNVKSSQTVVGQGYSLNINVTVANQGDYTEAFNVTVYANTTAIQTKTLTLTSGNSTTLTFSWNATGFTKGNYTISAIADTVPGETDTEDNTFINGWVKVVIPGNVNGDVIVDMKDITTILRAYGIIPGHPNYNANADVNYDGVVDMKDVTITLRNYGQTEENP